MPLVEIVGVFSSLPFRPPFPNPTHISLGGALKKPQGPCYRLKAIEHNSSKVLWIIRYGLYRLYRLHVVGCRVFALFVFSVLPTLCRQAS